MPRKAKLGIGQDDTTIYPLRLPRQLLAAWKAFVTSSQAGIAPGERDSPQEVLRAVMRRLTGQPRVLAMQEPAFAAPSPRQVNERKIDSNRKKRVELKLTESEYAALANIAASKEASIQWWLVSLIRAVLTRGVAVGGAELKVLAESNYQLMAIGRNLNQIAHHINADPAKHLHQLRAEQIAELAAAIDEHRQKTHAVIYSCSQRWEIA